MNTQLPFTHLLAQTFLSSIVLLCLFQVTAQASVPPLNEVQTDSVFLRFHGRGDVLRTVEPFASDSVFPGGAHASDPGDSIHARMRVRLAPFSEYEILDQTNNGDPSPARVLWTQGTIDQNNYAGFTIAYRYDTEELYFVVGDSGATSTGDNDERSRVWKVSTDIDDGEFYTIDWTYHDVLGEASCWIDGQLMSLTAVTNGSLQDAPQLNGSWNTGSLMGNLRSDGFSTLAGRDGWGAYIGDDIVVWPQPNGPSSGDVNVMDQNTSVLGDLSYAAFRWARATEDIVLEPWAMELKLDDPEDGDVPTDSVTNGLTTQLLMSAESFHDSMKPSWCATNTGQLITEWIATHSTTNVHPQPRQLMFYHHGLGDQKIEISELVDECGLQGELEESIVLCLGPDAEIEYWAIKLKDSGNISHSYSLIGNMPVSGVHTVTLPAGKPGLYRIFTKVAKNKGYSFRTNQGYTDLQGQVSQPESIYWGAYAPFSNLEGVSGLPATDAYAYIPEVTEKYDLKFENVSSASEVTQAGLHVSLSQNWDSTNKFQPSDGATFFPGSKFIRMNLNANWYVEARRFPFVLSNSRYAAEHYVRAGVTEYEGIGTQPNFTIWSPDERVLYERILEISAQGLGTWSSLIEDFQDKRVHIVDNPTRYYTLATYPIALPSIHTALMYQVTNSDSGKIGSIDHKPLESSLFHRYADSPKGVNNFDSFGASMLFWAGWDDTDANPYYSTASVDYFERRARCAMLSYARHIQGTRLRNSETDTGLHHGNAGLAGSDVLGFGLHWGRVYDLLTPEDRAALLPSVIMQLNYILNTNPTSTRNQDAHFIPFLYEAARLWESEMNGDTTVMDIAKNYAERIVVPFIEGQDVALAEAQGFDGSYSGMQNFYLSAGWLTSGDLFDPGAPADLLNPGNQEIRYDREWGFLNTAIDSQYSFWTHFMSPSYDGSRTVFGHDTDSRTGLGAVREQFGGAKVIGSRLNSQAARLLMRDGSDRQDLLEEPGHLLSRSNLNNLFDNMDSWVNDINGPVEAPNWWLETKNVTGARDGSKFDLLPLYAGGSEHLFNKFDVPLPITETLPAEQVVATGIVFNEIDEAFLTINTPNYYAVIATEVVGNYHYISQALDVYQIERPIENFANPQGGGDHDGEERIVSVDSNKHAYRGEEIGGVGLSLFYDKTLPAPTVVGRNWSPYTSHQLVGFTAGSINTHRRWANQRSKIKPELMNPGGSVQPYIVFDYYLNSTGDFDDSQTSLGTDKTVGYKVSRKLTFYEDRIQVDLTVELPDNGGVLEALGGLVENVPIEMDSRNIGTFIRDSRILDLDNNTLPWPSVNGVWDTWCASNWIDYQEINPPTNPDNTPQNPDGHLNVGLEYLNQEITWIQKDIPLPTLGNPSTFQYDIAVGNLPASQLHLGNEDEPSYTELMNFIRAFETRDPSADLDGDGEFTISDLRKAFQN